MGMRESKGESTLLRKRGAPVHEPGTRPQPFRPHVHVLVFRAYLLTEMPRSYAQISFLILINSFSIMTSKPSHLVWFTLSGW